jgi:SAM-dependent methyltransferase
MERIDVAQNIINECFVSKKQHGFKFDKNDKKNTIENLYKYYDEQLDKYIKEFKHDIELEKQYPFIRVKYIIPVSGLASNEIFKYSMIIWNKYLYGNGEYPYDLDGIIYQPLNQSYITNVRESKYADYKWKPVEKNTIDFYIRFEKDRTGKILNVFDNSNDTFENNKLYRICYLYSGKKTKDGETPVFFKEHERLYISHLFLTDGEVRDNNGDIIQDETVVEFSYVNKADLNEKYRWKPMKTRYDKTEMVNKYRKKFGNNIDVAERIWRSIVVPVRYSDIEALSNDTTYERHLNDMKKKITKESMIAIAKENVYYQIVTKLAENMRNFHNWVKSVAMFTYIGREYSVKSNRILDVGCGRGGDLMKYYHAKIDNGVCIDSDYENLHYAFDGAISRYNGLKKKYPAFPKLTFACVDFTIPLNAESQMSVVQDKTQTNRYIIESVFPNSGMKQFDILNMQFVFHYFMGNEKSWNIVCDNINKCLHVGGYMLITAFDAQRIIEVLGDNNQYTTYYTTDGEKKVFMEIVKKFNTPKVTKGEHHKVGLGFAIDVYNSLISNEGTYITEYLVGKEFLIDELKQKCNMSLVDTMLFDQLFEANRDNITRISSYLENEKTKSFLQNVGAYYEPTEFNKECFKITRLNRYYIFRKNENKTV